MKELDLYKNIKARRLELGMSQQELAEGVGYASGKSMIARIEAGDVDLGQSKIIQIAEVLKTTPDKLMGWSDERYDYSVNLSKDTDPILIELLETSQDFTEEQQQRLLEYAKMLKQYKEDK